MRRKMSNINGGSMILEKVCVCRGGGGGGAG